MGVHNEQVLDRVVVAGGHSTNALAASVLVAERIGGDSLDVTALAEGYDYLLVRLEFLAGQVGRFAAYLGAPLVTVLLLQRAQLLLDFGQDLPVIGQEFLHLAYGVLYFLVLLFELFAFQRRQPS